GTGRQHFVLSWEISRPAGTTPALERATARGRREKSAEAVVLHTLGVGRAESLTVRSSHATLDANGAAERHGVSATIVLRSDRRYSRAPRPTLERRNRT